MPEMNSRIFTELQEISKSMVRLEESHKNLTDKFNTMDEKLFGNGQPGIIAELRKRISKLEWFYIGLVAGTGVVAYIFKIYLQIVLSRR